MSVVPVSVMRRYLAKAARDVLSEDYQYRVPASIANAVQQGTLPAETLSIWKYVAGKMGSHFNYGAAVSYWRNKCARMGVVLPEEFSKENGTLGGSGSQGAFAVKTGDQIEDWVRETLKSKGLLAEVGNSVYDWKMEVNHFQREIEKAHADIALHLRAIAERKDPAGRNLGEKGLAQRQAWLEKAQAKLAEGAVELERCEKELAELEANLARYQEHKSPTLKFESLFQMLMKEAAKDFDKKAVLDAVARAVAEFEKGAEQSVAADGMKTANWLTNLIGKAWAFLKQAWDAFTGWVNELVDTNRELDELFRKAGV